MIPAVLLTLIALAIAAPGLRRVAPRASGVIVAIIVVCTAIPFGLALPAIEAGEVRLVSIPWVEQLGVALSFRLDGLSLLFSLLICVIGALVILHASGSMRSHPRLGILYATLLAFMASMLGLVTADNLLLLFVFWELTSVTSFLLIGLDHERPGARRAATQALLVTGLGGLCILAGLVLLGLSAGTFEITELLDRDVRSTAAYPVIVVLILLGCFTKSAIVPFHFWLPNAMEAPTPVSALLHSSTMVKAGVYLVARLHPSLGGTLLWDDALIILGGITMLVGAVVALRQGTLKGVLAYSTICSLGVLMMLIGLGAPKAAVAYLLAHAMFKASLFLVSGTVTRLTGRNDPESLRGLFRSMPLIATAGLVGALSMAGLFPLAGFVGKELMLKAGLAHPEWAIPATTATFVAAVLTVIAAATVGIRPFVGSGRVAVAGAESWREWLGPMLLSIGTILVGFAPGLFASSLVRSAVVAMSETGAAPKMTLRAVELLWPPTTATVLSILAIGIGGGLFLARSSVRPLLSRARIPAPLQADHLYDVAFHGVGRLARGTTAFVQCGHLHVYVRTTLITITVVLFLAILNAGVPWLGGDSLDPLATLLLACLVVGAVATLSISSSLASIAVLGGVGLLMAMIFVYYGAPDVAMTQFAAETLLVIIFVLVLIRMPRTVRRTPTLGRIRDLVVAGGFGLAIAVGAYVAARRSVLDPVSDRMASMAVPEGYGRNVVNVILVDFRALDTLGEIFVLGIAAVGVSMLTRRVTTSSNPTSPESAP